MTATSPPPAARARGWGRRHLAGAVVVVSAVTGGVAGVQLRPAPVSALAAGAGQSGTPTAPVPRVVVQDTGPDGRVVFARPLSLVAQSGRLTEVTGAHPDGSPLVGSLTSAGAFTSTGGLSPAATYQLTVTAADLLGAVHSLPLTVRTTAASRVLRATVSPRSGAVVGVGMPIVVRLDHDVADSDRAEVERRLTVRSTPAVRGAWRWVDDRTLRYRPALHWPARAQVDVTADLRRLGLADGTAGEASTTAAVRIGERVVSVVDVEAKTMTVTRDGKVARVMRASMGRPRFATRGGNHLVLEKQAVKIMDSATVGLAKGTDDYYRTRVEWAVRLTYSGTFTHAAPWSVRDQGVRNVSHGCINLSPADAKWFYDLARRGDVVEVKGSPLPPRRDDPGTADWNMPFDSWRAGSALTADQAP